MGLFDKLKKGTSDFDNKIAELQAANAALSKNTDAATRKDAQNAANAMSSFTPIATGQKRGIRVIKVEETELMCSCGCGQKAEYIFEVGDIKIPISNSCGNNLSIKHLDVGKVVDDDILEVEAGSFTGTSVVNGNKISFKMRYGLASPDDYNNVVFYNETSGKGVVFTWENLQFLAILLGILG